MTFIEQIIEFLTQKGTIDPKLLFESPFDEKYEGGIIGAFQGADGAAKVVIDIVKEINRNAEVG